MSATTHVIYLTSWIPFIKLKVNETKSTTVAYQYSQEENYKDEDKSIGVSLRTDQESSGK